MAYELHEMDCRLAMSMLMEPNSVDSIVCDPPYGLSKEPDMAEVLRHWLNGDDYTHTGSGFMGKSWDSFVPGPSVWREAYRVLKPGGYLIAFFGTRTYDLGTLAIRLAGFEIRDQLAWVFGSGFPKSLDVSKAIDKAAGAEREILSERANRSSFDPDAQGGGGFQRGTIVTDAGPTTDAAKQWQGWGTALKPAYEPIVLARKPFDCKTVAANVLTHGTGALNVDGCRVAITDTAYARNCSGDRGHAGSRSTEQEGVTNLHSGGGSAASGRWPANLCHDGSDEVLAEFPTTTSGKMRAGTIRAAQDEPGSVVYGTYGGNTTDTDTIGDSGSAARFFKTCQLGDEEWLVQNLPAAYVNFATNRLSLQNLFVAFVQSDAAIWDRLEGSPSSDWTELSTLVTLNESKTICETLMQAMLTFENALWLDLPLDGLSLSLNAVQFAAQRTPTGIILTMTDLLISSGFVEPVTFNITRRNSDHGAKDCEPSSARFKYCAKASKADRNAGCDTLPVKAGGMTSNTSGQHMTRRDEGYDPAPVANHHPTVKPTDLMRWLCRLVTPPGGMVLDPFTGSGSTGKAALLEGFQFVGCEMTPEYVAIAHARLAYAAASLPE